MSGGFEKAGYLRVDDWHGKEIRFSRPDSREALNWPERYEVLDTAEGTREDRSERAKKLLFTVYPRKEYEASLADLDSLLLEIDGKSWEGGVDGLAKLLTPEEAVDLWKHLYLLSRVTELERGKSRTRLGSASTAPGSKATSTVEPAPIESESSATAATL
jgi:hypothetical protein